MQSDQDHVARYEQLLRTAPPASLQKVHSEAFAKLTPEQRIVIFRRLLAQARADDERPVNSNAYALASAATLVERRRPGTLKQLLDEAGADPAWGQPNRSFYATFAGIIMGTAVALGVIVAYDPGLLGLPDVGANPDGLLGELGTDFIGF